MPANLFQPAVLAAVIEERPPATSFLRDRYFPHNSGKDVFTTESILVEFKKGGRKMAPFVAPRVNGITMLRDGQSLTKFTPGRIAPRRNLTEDQLKKRNFGEAFYANETPEVRSQMYLVEDLEDLDEQTTRREELMASQTMINNGIIMEHETGKDGVTEDREIRFYGEASNPSEYTPATPWNDPAANIIGDITAMAAMLEQGGLPASELVVSPNVANYILTNDDVQKQMDIRNFNIGSVSPKDLGEGAAAIATINCSGRIITVISYGATYEDDNGINQLYMPAGTCVLTAPAAGHAMYGAVSRVQKDGNFKTYVGRRNPRVKIDEDSNSRDLIVESRPLLMPHKANPWVSADVD